MYDDDLIKRLDNYLEIFATPLAFIAKEAKMSYYYIYNWKKGWIRMSHSAQDRVREFLVKRGY